MDPHSKQMNKTYRPRCCAVAVVRDTDAPYELSNYAKEDIIETYFVVPFTERLAQKEGLKISV